MIISLVEYAKLNDREQSTVRRLAEKGRFKTAQKVGRNWIIDSEEPYPVEMRIKTGIKKKLASNKD